MYFVFDSRSLTKVESVVFVAIGVVAAVGGGAAYFMLSGEASSETIKVGVITDIDVAGGEDTLQGAILAAEQVNAEGGILGRNITIVAADDDTLTGFNPDKASIAMNKLISSDKADFVLTTGIASMINIYQEIAAEHKKILFHYGDNDDDISQKVLDDYDRYKYYFRLLYNETVDDLSGSKTKAAMQECTGLNKVAIWKSGSEGESVTFDDDIASYGELGMEVVHTASIPFETMDFTSYFVHAESKGAEIIIPKIWSIQGGVPLVKEYATRESPTVIWNLPYVLAPDAWEWSGGACNYVTGSVDSVVAGYPLTSHVIPTREAYLERWGEPLWAAFIAFAYDVVRFVLPDAIERAGTIETDAVIAALEETNLEETSLYRDVTFTSSHDILDIEMGATYFQWQNGELAIVYPKEVMIADNVTFMFPDWPGPWD